MITCWCGGAAGTVVGAWPDYVFRLILVVDSTRLCIMF